MDLDLDELQDNYTRPDGLEVEVANDNDLCMTFWEVLNDVYPQQETFVGVF